MKKFILGFLTAALLFTALPIGAAIEEYICYRADYKVIVTGSEYINDELPILNYKGNTYAPFRSILEAAGLNVNWNAELKQAEVTIAPVPESTKEVEVVSEVPLNKYGLPDFTNYEKPELQNNGEYRFFVYNEEEYIVLSGRPDLPFKLPKPYRFECPIINGKVSFIVQLIKNKEDGTDILINEVPYALYSDSRNFCIQYDYYINTILPLIQGAE